MILELLSQSAAHGGDERRSFPAAVLRQQEVDVALRRQLDHSLLHDPREAGGEGETTGQRETTEEQTHNADMNVLLPYV